MIKLFNIKKDIKYYAKKYGINATDICCNTLVQNKPKLKKYVIFVNETQKNSNKDWLRYLADFDMMFILNDNLEIEQISIDVTLDVSPFTNGKKYYFKKPLKLDIPEKWQNKRKWKRIDVWEIK